MSRASESPAGLCTVAPTTTELCGPTFLDWLAPMDGLFPTRLWRHDTSIRVPSFPLSRILSVYC